MRGSVLCVSLLASVLPVLSAPVYHSPPPPKEGMKEKFKEFLRKVVYGITPTTIFTTLKPWKFPEEYDPIRVLEWQLKEEHRLGITTHDFDPILTEVTKLWDGFWNDPTIDDITFWCMRHLHANDSMPTTVKRYWEEDWGNSESLDAIAEYWKKEAVKENREWWATAVTTKYVPMEDLTADSQGGSWRCSPNFGDSHIDSEDRRILAEAQRVRDEEYEKHYAKYNYNYSPRPGGESDTKSPGKATTAPQRDTEAPQPTTEVRQHAAETTAMPTQRKPVQIHPMIDPISISEYVDLDPTPRKPKW